MTVGYRLRTDGGDPSRILYLRPAMRLLRTKLFRHPAGYHYRVNGGPLRTRTGAVYHARRRLRRAAIGDVVEVLVDFAAHHTYTIRKVSAPEPVPPAGQKLVGWCVDRIGTPYVLGGDTDAGLDCSGQTMRATEYATAGAVVLPHYSVAQWNDPRVVRIKLAQAKPGDLLFFHDDPAIGGPSHVAPLYQVDSAGLHWVIDEEPGTESYAGRVIAGGLRIRPCAPGYFVSLTNLMGVGRIAAVNGAP